MVGFGCTGTAAKINHSKEGVPYGTPSYLMHLAAAGIVVAAAAAITAPTVVTAAAPDDDQQDDDPAAVAAAKAVIAHMRTSYEM